MSIPSTNILRYDRQPTGTSMCVFQSDWNPQSRRKKWQPRARKCHRMPLWQLLWIASIYSISVCEQVDLESRMSGSVSSILATPHITILLFHCRQSYIIHNHSNHSWLWPNFTNEIFRGLRRHWHALGPDSIPYVVRDITFTSRDPQHHGTFIKARLTPNSVTCFFMRRSVLPGLKRIEMDAK